MKIFWGIIGIIITLYIRIWIINNSFKGKKFNKKINILIFIISLFSVSFLYFYPEILGTIGLKNLNFSNNLSITSIGLFIFYCLSFLILASILFNNLKNKENISFTIVAILLFVGIGIGGITTGISTIVMYYLISCYAEEILKFSVGQNALLTEKHTIKTSDLILFTIISGLGFSVIENIFYLIVLAIGGGGSFISTMGRSIFTTLLHIVATGMIAYIITKKDSKKLRLKCLIGIICGFALHGIYNLCLNYGLTFLTILILVICYFLLTYLLFNSDSIYSN